MARPKKCRRVCSEPSFDCFSPDGAAFEDEVVLSVDEYETIRLIDYEKMTQEECAKQLGIARTTVTEMYEKARYKIADSIINGHRLSIRGGNYEICDGIVKAYCGKPCGRGSSDIRVSGENEKKV